MKTHAICKCLKKIFHQFFLRVWTFYTHELWIFGDSISIRILTFHFTWVPRQWSSSLFIIISSLGCALSSAIMVSNSFHFCFLRIFYIFPHILNLFIHPLSKKWLAYIIVGFSESHMYNCFSHMTLLKNFNFEFEVGPR